MRSRIVLLLVFVLAAIVPVRRGEAQNAALHKVNRIFVSDMGSGAEPQRFHGLLEDELQRVGFAVSDRSGDADAILTGEFSTEANGDRSFARVSVLLKSRDGKRTLWSGDFIAQHKGEGHEDVVKTLAITCAERLRKEWEKG
jgi:hypothetical protein